jgi:hypothetical protein
MGFINMFSQLCGATALAVSGYIGIALNSAPGNPLEEYRGIWLVDRRRWAAARTGHECCCSKTV